MKRNSSLSTTVHPNTLAGHFKSACARWLPLLICLMLSATVQAQFSYTDNDGTITIDGYTGPGGDVAIPDTINGLPVTSINYMAFRSCTNVTGVSIPDSVTYIGMDAFYGCTSLTNVMIGKGVTNITLFAFRNCAGLTAITVDSLNLSYSSEEGVLFNYDKTMLIACPGGKTGACTIPNSVANIGYGAFSGCARLAGITIPESVTSIGNDAFSGCASLASITIPESVTSIGFLAFSGCASLASITIPKSVNSIGFSAFLGCTGLTAITVDSLNLMYSSVDGVLFNKNRSTLLACPGSKSGAYTVPDSVPGQTHLNSQ